MRLQKLLTYLKVFSYSHRIRPAYSKATCASIPHLESHKRVVCRDERDENVEFRSSRKTGYNADFQNSTSALKNRMSKSKGPLSSMAPACSLVDGDWRVYEDARLACDARLLLFVLVGRCFQVIDLCLRVSAR